MKFNVLVHSVYAYVLNGRKRRAQYCSVCYSVVRYTTMCVMCGCVVVVGARDVSGCVGRGSSL